jgi:hypothetical protein
VQLPPQSTPNLYPAKMPTVKGPSLLAYNLSAAQTFYLRLKNFVMTEPQFKELLQWTLSYPGLREGELEHVEFQKALEVYIENHCAHLDDKQKLYRKLCFVTGLTQTVDPNMPIFQRTEQQISLKFFRLFIELIQRYQPNALKVTLSL